MSTARDSIFSAVKIEDTILASLCEQLGIENADDSGAAQGKHNLKLFVSGKPWSASDISGVPRPGITHASLPHLAMAFLNHFDKHPVQFAFAKRIAEFLENELQPNCLRQWMLKLPLNPYVDANVGALVGRAAYYNPRAIAPAFLTLPQDKNRMKLACMTGMGSQAQFEQGSYISAIADELRIHCNLDFLEEFTGNLSVKLSHRDDLPYVRAFKNVFECEPCAPDSVDKTFLELLEAKYKDEDEWEGNLQDMIMAEVRKKKDQGAEFKETEHGPDVIANLFRDIIKNQDRDYCYVRAARMLLFRKFDSLFMQALKDTMTPLQLAVLYIGFPCHESWRSADARKAKRDCGTFYKALPTMAKRIIACFRFGWQKSDIGTAYMERLLREIQVHHDERAAVFMYQSKGFQKLLSFLMEECWTKKERLPPTFEHWEHVYHCDKEVTKDMLFQALESVKLLIDDGTKRTQENNARFAILCYLPVMFH